MSKINREKHQNQKGQALIELCLSITFCIVILGFLLQMLWLPVAYYWVDHFSYQGSLCLASGYGANHCRQALRQRLLLLLNPENIERLKMEDQSRFETTSHVRLGAARWKFVIRKRID